SWARLRLLAHLLIKSSHAPEPVALRYCAARQIHQAIEYQISRHQPDIIFASSSIMAQFIPEKWASRTVVDLVNVNFQDSLNGVCRTVFKTRERAEDYKLYEYEMQLIRRFAGCLVSTDQDFNSFDLDEFTRRARLRKFRNGVDVALYSSNVTPLRVSLNWRERLADPRVIRIIFIGSLNTNSNIEGVRFFANEVFPLLRARVPQAEFYIVGPDPTREIRRLGKRDGIVVTGTVEDVRPYLNAATVCIIPTAHSDSTEHKALEAMAAGCPIVTTPEVAERLQAQDTRHLLVARDANEFAASVELLIADSRLREEIAGRARTLVMNEHDWQSLVKEFADLIESVIDRIEKRDTLSKAPGDSTLAKLRRRGI
ncbi:MAG TPA: glycosyltransferase, partial [Blastocatellia bacterium]|nr:glycosyltransferase [Blastocatellia bacterium]